MRRLRKSKKIHTDGSFLVVKEIFEYGYPDDSATEPQLYFHEYGYHYQRPQAQTFFRYDYHPEVGSSETHPLYHLHASGWKKEAEDLLQVPRFPVYPTTLGEVLELIRINFFHNDLNFDLIKEYALKMGNLTIIKRLGYILEKTGLLDKYDSIFKDVKISKGYAIFDILAPQKGHYNSRWMLLINKEIELERWMY